MKLQPGQVANFSFGPTPERIILSVRVDRHLDGVAIIVNSGRTTLDRTYGNDNLVGARAYLEHIRDAARAGQAVWLIEAGVSALIDAAQATQAEQDMIDGIQANMDQATPQPVDVADILDGADRNWRHHLRTQLVAQAAKQSGVRVIHPTRTNVHVKPLTPAELDRVRNHRDGTVTLLPGQSWLVLRAIYRRIGGTPTYRPGTQIMTSLRLNQRGLTVAATSEERAA